MAFLFTSTRIRIPTLARTADRPSIPRVFDRRIITGQPRVPSFFPPPPARRRFEPMPIAPQSRKPLGAASRSSEPPRRPTNRQIPFSHVYVLDPDTNARSPTKHCLESLLAMYLHTRTSERRVIELVASTPEPIVRVTTRAEVEARYRAMKRALRKGARASEEDKAKEVQLTWGVAWADVEHKLRKARRDLDKGHRVVVAVTIKHGHRPSSRQELVAFADRVVNALVGVGEECKEREITQRSMVLSFRKVEGDEDS